MLDGAIEVVHVPRATFGKHHGSITPGWKAASMWANKDDQI